MLTQRTLQKRWQASTALRRRSSFCRKTFGSPGSVLVSGHRHQNYDVQVRCEKLQSLSVLMLTRQTWGSVHMILIMLGPHESICVLLARARYEGKLERLTLGLTIASMTVQSSHLWMSARSMLEGIRKWKMRFSREHTQKLALARRRETTRNTTNTVGRISSVNEALMISPLRLESFAPARGWRLDMIRGHKTYGIERHPSD